MKKLVIPFLILIGLYSCTKDFNELEDTDQRFISFSFTPQNYLSTILNQTENGYSTNTLNQLDSEHRLRIIGYCYNLNDSLLDKTLCFSNLHDDIILKFRHLHCDSLYHFCFIADIVQYFSDIDYFETWHQLGIHYLDSLYLVSFEHDKIAERNILLFADSTLSPSNQTIPISMRPITYNGYCIFTNLNGIDKIDGFVKKSQSFFLNNNKTIKLSQYEYNFHHNAENSFVFPVTSSYSDKSITLKVHTTKATGQSTKNIIIHNEKHYPFVAVIDCQNLSLESLTFYETLP